MKIFSGSAEENKPGILLFILSAFLFLYVAVRGYCLAITWDEAWSYLEFVRKGFLSPYYFTGGAANNHLLNTWLVYLTSSSFGVNEFTLRIPNILAYGLFLFYTAKISNEFPSSLVKISSLLILNLNPYLVDFFSISRGYGLSFGLMAGSLWHLYLFLKNNFQKKNSLYSLVFAMLAVSAYLAMIHFAFALFMIILMTDFLMAGKESNFRKRFFSALKKNRVASLLFLIFLLFIIPRITGLRNADAFFYGGTGGFWSDTMVTVFERSLYEKPYPSNLKYILSGFALAISAIAFFISAWIIFKKKISREACFLPALCFLLFYCSLVSALQYHILGTPYLTNRTALFLLVLFSFLFVFLLNDLALTKKIFIYIFPLCCIAQALHFYNCYNLKYVLEFDVNADVREMIHDIDSLKYETPVQKFNTDVGVSFDFLGPFNYYRCVYNFTWLTIADKAKKNDPLNDFLLLTEKEYKKIHTDSFVILKTYPLFKSMLLKRKYKPSEYSICLSKKSDFDVPNDSFPLTHSISDKFSFSGKTSSLADEKNEYSDGINYKIDVSKNPVKNSMLLVKTMVLMERLDNTHAAIVVSMERNKEIYFWHASLTNDFAIKAKEWFPVYFSCFIPEEVRQDDLLKIYLWNKKSPVYIDDLEMRWITGVY
ncbi:MAG TPA: hypothetical protein VJY62_01420 [Bacteroidia bacterium]|nr:hypothetical protein [Bacteroidia bacterium]